MNSRSSTLLLVAVAGGLAQIGAGVSMYLAGVYFAPWSMAVSIAVLLAAIVAGTLRVRSSDNDRTFRYGDALFAGVAISLATAVLYALYNVVSIRFLYPHFLDDLARVRLVMKAARHMPVGSFAEERGSLSAGGIALSNLLRLSVIGFVLSAVAAVFVRRNSRGHQALEAAPLRGGGTVPTGT